MKVKEKTRRGSKKYPYLSKESNLKSRRYFLEANEYVNGVYDQEGNELIRPMTDDEKAWMNQFLAEHVGAEKLNDNSIHKQTIPQKKRLRDIKKRLEELKTIILEYNKKYNSVLNSKKGVDEKVLDLIDQDRAVFIKERETLSDELYYLDYQKYNYGCNNARNADLYNMLRRTGKLRIVDPFKLGVLGTEDIEEYAIKHIYTEYEAEDFQQMIDTRSGIEELPNTNDDSDNEGNNA